MNHMSLIGRKKERESLLNKFVSPKSELVAVLGRRRVGKTYLIREVFQKEMFFQFTGLYRSNMSAQLNRFTHALELIQKNKIPIATPSDWFIAFDILATMISKSRSKKKKVIFLDEFPWMATNRSQFLTAFTDFWNSFASNRKDLMIIICVSSASWMINKVLRNKGGLHNRVTERIILEPFSLSETASFLKKKNIKMDRYNITQLYMAIGGIPFYLEQINMGESASQAMDRLCFQKGSILQLEYKELFSSLFTNSSKHESIIEILIKHPNGLSRNELLKKSKLNSGGGSTSILEELMHSGFISISVPYGNKRNQKIYKVKDFYTLFYHKYIKKYSHRNENVWQKISATPSWRSWSGLAFENICMAHIMQIKKALKIDGILSEASTWQSIKTDESPGAQIDLLIDRADGIINICEIKFSINPYIITKDYAQKLRLKLSSFKHNTKSKKTLFPTMITTYDIVNNKHSHGFIQQSVVLDDLFKS